LRGFGLQVWGLGVKVAVCLCVFVYHSEINSSELVNTERLQSVLVEALAYEKYLLVEKHKLRQRLAIIADIFNKP